MSSGTTDIWNNIRFLCEFRPGKYLNGIWNMNFREMRWSVWKTQLMMNFKIIAIKLSRGYFDVRFLFYHKQTFEWLMKKVTEVYVSVSRHLCQTRAILGFTPLGAAAIYRSGSFWTICPLVRNLFSNNDPYYTKGLKIFPPLQDQITSTGLKFPQTRSGKTSIPSTILV